MLIPYPITKDTTPRQINQIMNQLAGVENAGLYYTSWLNEEGWLISAILEKDGVTQHWNYHPGRTQLTKAYETARKDYIDAVCETMKSLKRLGELVPVSKRERC